MKDFLLKPFGFLNFFLALFIPTIFIFFAMADKKIQKIQVALRCRPINREEIKNGSRNIIEVNESKKQVCLTEGDHNKNYVFDKVFGPAAEQIEVYKSLVSPMIDEVLLGYNCTIFAYGQTGSGKTFTMEGERSLDKNFSWENDPLAGIIPRTLSHLFSKLEALDTEFSVRASFMELYNEEIFDLLSTEKNLKKLRLFEDSTKKGSIIVQGLQEIYVKSKYDVYEILKQGSERKKIACTSMNANSSRSHTVFTITVHISEYKEEEYLMKIGKFNLVDLAGSENVSKSGAVDMRLREAGNINQSLLTLGRVITALVEKNVHIPYRESKLTRILQDSLGGNTKTTIIATISPASYNNDEILSTLDYAKRARSITNTPKINQKMTKSELIEEYVEKIKRLESDLKASREQNGIYIDEKNFQTMQEDIALKNLHIDELSAEVNTFKSYNNEIQNRYNELTSKFNTMIEEKCAVEELNQKLKESNRILHSQASQIKEVADKVTEEISLVHDKSRKLENIKDYNANIQSEVNKHLSQFKQRMGEKPGIANAKNRALLNVFQYQLHQYQEEIVRSTEENIEKISEYMHRNFSTSNNRQSSVDGDSIISESSDECLLKQLSAHEEKAEGIFVSNKFDLDKMVSLFENDSHILEHLKSDFFVNFAKMIKTQDQFFSKREQALAELLEKSRRFFCQVPRITSDLEEKLDKQVKEMNSYIQNLVAVMNDMKDSVAQSNHEINGNNVEEEELLKAFQQEEIVSQKQNTENLTKNSQIISQKLDKALSELKDNTSITAELCQNVSTNNEKHLKIFDNYKSTIENHFSSEKNLLEEQLARNRQHNSCCDNFITKSSALVKNLGSEYEASINDIHDLANENINTASTLIHQCKDYTKTECTPVKKSYSYPRVLEPIFVEENIALLPAPAKRRKAE